MTAWDYKLHNGVYSGVGDERVRDLIRNGSLDRDTQIAESGTEHWQPLGSTIFKIECDRAQAFATRGGGRNTKAEAAGRRGRRWGGVLLLFALIGSGGLYYWNSQRLTCSRDEVRDLVTSLVKEDLLHLTAETVSLLNIQTLGDLDSGGKRCRADVSITTSKAGVDHEFRAVEYSVERRGNMIHALGRMTY